MRLMTLGSVLGMGDGLSPSATAQVRGHALALVQNLHGGGRGPHFHGLLGERVGDRVEVAVEGDVVVDVDLGVRPLAQVETLGRQRPQSRAVQALKQAGARALAFAEGPLVEFGEQFADGLVEIFQAEEPVMPERGHDPTFRQQHAARP